MKTTIATIAAILLAFTSEITAIIHKHETKTELATGFSLLDDAGDHVLNFGAESHGRRLDSTSKIYLKFKAFGSSFQYNLHRSPSVSVPDTKIYTYSKHDGNYLKFDAPEETRSFSSKANDAALTFLDHDNIMGTLLLHNRTMEFNSNGVDTLLVHTSLHQGVNCGVGPNNVMLHDGHDENKRTNLRNPDEKLRVAEAGDQEIPGHRRKLLQKWFGSGSCYSRDDVTRRFMVGIGVGSQMVARRKFTTDQQIFNFVVAIFNQANLVYREQLNLLLSIGAIVVAGGMNKRLDGSGQKVGNVQAPLWDNPNCDDTLATSLTNLQNWEHVEKFGSWQVLDECFWNRRSGTSIGLATTGSICRPKGYYSNVKGYPNTGVNWYSSNLWKTFAHELGHNFGARHSFEEGQGKTGGIMDYGDGKLNGEYQFNTAYRKTEVCSTIGKVLGSCAHGFQTFQAACGNGLLEDGESCECNDKGTSCRFCNGCRLQAGKVCSPDAINAVCCTSTGQLADTSVVCKVGEDTGTCGGQKGECLLSPFQNFRLGHVCGIQSSDAPCKLTFKQSADSACNIQYSRTRCNGKYCNAVETGALCTYNGELRTCIERSSFTEMACKGPLPQGTSTDCVGTWGGWSTCKLSGSCPSTSGKQTRKFTVAVAAVGNGEKCEASDGFVQSQACNYNQCPEDCVAKWEDQVKCSATCGDATKTQRLRVTSPARNGGKSCTVKYGAENDGLKQVACTGLSKCPDPAPPVVACQGGYGGFRACIANVGDCGAGKKTKAFVVTVKESGGGKPCGENPPIIQSCQIPCNVDCVGEWVLGTRCSKLCGPESVRAKTYKVKTPKENRGKECPHKDGTLSSDPCRTENCPVPAKKGECSLHTGKTLSGVPDVGGGSPSDEQWTLDKCYSVCMDASACNSFSYTPDFGKCLLWSAVKTKSVSVKDLPQISGTNFYRECKVTFVASDTCGDRWRAKAFPGAGALTQTTGKERKDCNQACDSNKACSAWSFNKVSAKCQLWPREYAANSDSKWVTDTNSDVYLCPTRKKEPQTTTARPTGTTTTTTTTLNPSCACDDKGERTGRIGCQKPNDNNGLPWCYVSKGCDLVKWLKKNNPSFQAGVSKRYDMKWRQCTYSSKTTPAKDDAWCKTIELQRRYSRNNGVCDAVLNIASCQFDGGDCCAKGGAQPNMGLCKDNPYKCVCLDPAVLGGSKTPTPGCQNAKACNFNKDANTGTDDIFCKFPNLGYDCQGKCIDDDICGGSYLEKRGCCRTDDRRAIFSFTNVAATSLQQCTTACNRDKQCTGFQWQQGLRSCLIFNKDLPSYGETACREGGNTQCFINLDPPASSKQKCLTGPGINKVTDSKGQDCSEYEKNPNYCGFFDTSTFKSKELCCACEEFKCEDTNNPGKTDRFGLGCGDYAKDPLKYCGFSTRDSKTFSHTTCCACQNDVMLRLRNAPEETKPLGELSGLLGLSTSVLAGIITASILGVVIIVAIAVAVAVVKSRMKKKMEEKNGPKPPGYEQTIGEIVQFDGV